MEKRPENKPEKFPLAPDFTLENQRHEAVRFSDILKNGPVLLVFYPGDFTPVCTSQLCNYRDSLESFQRFGVQLVGVSFNTPLQHKAFAEKYGFDFPLLSDPKKETAKLYGCTSLLMLGNVSRAVFIVSADGRILYRYVEPTSLTRRKADELLTILVGLKQSGAI